MTFSVIFKKIKIVSTFCTKILKIESQLKALSALRCEYVMKYFNEEKKNNVKLIFQKLLKKFHCLCIV